MVDSRMSLQLVLFVAFTRFLITCQGRYHHHHIKHKHHTHSHPPLAQISTPPSSPSLSPSPSPSPSPSQSPSPSPSPSQSPSPSPSPSQSPSPSPSESPSPSPSPHGDYPTNNGTSPNNSSSNVFDVRSFGAVGDGVTDDTQAFKTAWDTVCQLESAVGVLFVPAGYSFMIQSTIFTGPCQSSFVFHVDGTLMPPDGPEEWPKNNSKHQWLVFYKVNDLSLQGGGVIDGRGGKWWDLPCKPHKGVNGSTLPGPCDSPIAIRFFMSSNLTVKDIRIRDSPQFHFRFDGCSNVHIESIHITAPALSPNTDGIHIENTNNVQIYDSVISNGDDCVSIGSGCYDVDIKNITCGPGHGISIGSLGNHNSRACVSNITVRDSVIKNADNGVRIKTWQGGHGAVSGITFTNIHMDNVRNPIIIDQFYCLAKTCSNQTSAVFVSDIVYTQIKGTYDVRSPPIHFGCSDSVPCANITLSDVELLPAQGEILLDPYCLNAYGDSQTVTIPPVWCLQDDFPGSLQENALDYC